MKIYALTILFFNLLTSCASKKSDSDNNFQQKIVTTDIKQVQSNSIQIKETLNGWLKDSVDESSVINKIGIPEIKGKNEMWEAVGLYVQQWEYKKLGIKLDMSSDIENAKKQVLNITIVLPCSMKTSQGIGIGSTARQVKDKYNSIIDKSFSNDSSIVVGSIYGGTVFTIHRDLVTQIFIGVAAE